MPAAENTPFLWAYEIRYWLSGNQKIIGVGNGTLAQLIYEVLASKQLSPELIDNSLAQT